MASATGILTFSKSLECQFDSDQLTAAMNNLIWDLSNGFWEHHEGNLYINNYSDEPFAGPMRQVFIVEDQNGIICSRTKKQFIDDDDIIDVEYQPMEFEDIAKFLSPYIQSGWIQITSIKNEGLQLAIYEQLRIHSGGRLEYTKYVNGDGSNYEEEFTYSASNN